MDDPGLGVVGDNRLPRLMRSILHPRFGAYLESFINPLQNALARHLPGARDLAYGLTGMVAPQNLRPLDVAESGGSRLAKLIEMGFLLVGQNQLRAPGCSCHQPSIAGNKTVWIRFIETLYQATTTWPGNWPTGFAPSPERWMCMCSRLMTGPRCAWTWIGPSRNRWGSANATWPAICWSL